MKFLATLEKDTAFVNHLSLFSMSIQLLQQDIIIKV